MENDTPVPDEKKAKVDPQSGEIEPAPIDMEGARVMANEASEDLDDETSLDDQDVRQAAEDYVTTRGADDTENFKARLREGAPRDD
jgi:hypothetical protein